MISYSQDIILNSKNEYNANCLARVKVDESRYEQKKQRKDGSHGGGKGNGSLV